MARPSSLMMRVRRDLENTAEKSKNTWYTGPPDRKRCTPTHNTGYGDELQYSSNTTADRRYPLRL